MAKCHTICTQQKRPVNIVKNINKNLTATIRTKYGNTRKIRIRDSIRQGGVLSVIEYANIIDEIAKEINTENIGTTKIGDTTIEEHSYTKTNTNYKKCLISQMKYKKDTTSNSAKKRAKQSQ